MGNIRERAKAAAAKRQRQPVNMRRTIGMIAGIVLVALMVLIIGSYAIQYPRKEAQIEVALYCGLVLDRADCEAYVPSVMAVKEAAVMACYHEWKFPEHETAFYGCLRDAGI